MAALAVGLAFFMLTLDGTGKEGPIEELGWTYAGGPEGARTLLSTVAGSMITVAGTVFSITIVAMTLASSQFGPRLLRNFMQDTGNQIVLGTFIATFIYCLLILRTVRGDDYNKFVPQLSVTVGVVLALASIGVLIYFIHHASTSIQASSVIAEVGRELEGAIERLFPEKVGEGVPPQRRAVAEIPPNFEEEAVPILARKSGYLQAIDDEKLMKIAQSQDLLLRMNYRPGHFIVEGSVLVMVFPGKKVTEVLTNPINKAFILGIQRTEQQDIEFCVNQLVEIALRAISPGINDPLTAIRCIDQLSAGFCRLAQRDFPSHYRYDSEQNLRIITEPITFAGLTDAAFNQIRQYSGSDVAVRIRLLEAIAQIATHTRNEKDCAALLHHAKMLESASQDSVSQESDLRAIEGRYLSVVKAIKHRGNKKLQ